MPKPSQPARRSPGRPRIYPEGCRHKPIMHAQIDDPVIIKAVDEIAAAEQRSRNWVIKRLLAQVLAAK